VALKTCPAKLTKTSLQPDFEHHTQGRSKSKGKEKKVKDEKARSHTRTRESLKALPFFCFNRQLDELDDFHQAKAPREQESSFSTKCNRQQQCSPIPNDASLPANDTEMDKMCPLAPLKIRITEYIFGFRDV